MLSTSVISTFLNTCSLASFIPFAFASSHAIPSIVLFTTWDVTLPVTNSSVVEYICALALFTYLSKPVLSRVSKYISTTNEPCPPICPLIA